MGNGDALELMKAAHKRSQDAMEAAEYCSESSHKAVVDGIRTAHSDSEIIYFALQEIPTKVHETIKKEAPQDEPVKKFGMVWKPIESRDIPRIIGAIGIVLLLLERFGALQPILEAFAKR